MNVAEVVATIPMPWGPFLRKLGRVLQLLAVSPADSVSSFASRGDEAAFYEVVNDKRCEPRRVLDGHRIMVLDEPNEETQAGTSRHLAIHDTTSLSFGGQRDGLYPIHGGKNSNESGLFLHASLLAERRTDGTVLPETLAHHETYTRKPKTTTTKKKKSATKKKSNGKPATTQQPTKSATTAQKRESARWVRGIRGTNREVEQRGDEVVHICDCEADDYEIFHAASSQGFVIRARHDRKLFDEHGKPSIKMSATVNLGEGVELEEITLKKRAPKKQPAANKKHPPREQRQAKLLIGWHVVTLPRPQRAAKNLPKTMDVTLVWVREDPSTIPENGEGIEWTLLTNLEVNDATSAKEVVELYRKRWLVEDFFKVFKAGTAIEARQHRSRETIQNLMGMLMVIALEMFRSLKVWREMSESPAETVFDEFTLEVLKEMDVSSKPKKLKNFTTLTVMQVVVAIAQLGGYKPNNHKPPGFKVLWRGHHLLTHYKRAFRAARNQPP